MVNIYTFNLSDYQDKMIDFICAQTNLVSKKVSAEKFGLSLYQILNEDKAISVAHFNEEMLIFNCDQQQLDVILQMMKAVGLYIPYKAIITPANLSWSPVQLIDELKLEHQAMKGKNK